MKIVIIAFIVGLVASPVIGLAQVSEILVSPTQLTDTAPRAAQESAAVFPPKEIEVPGKCGLLNFELGRECGVGI